MAPGVWEALYAWFLCLQPGTGKKTFEGVRGEAPPVFRWEKESLDPIGQLPFPLSVIESWCFGWELEPRLAVQQQQQQQQQKIALVRGDMSAYHMILVCYRCWELAARTANQYIVVRRHVLPPYGATFASQYV